MWTDTEISRQRIAARTQAITELERRITNARYYVDVCNNDPLVTDRCRLEWEKTLANLVAERNALAERD